MRRDERALRLWGSGGGRVVAVGAVCWAVLGFCLPAQAAVTRTGTLQATVAENLRTGESSTRYTLKSAGKTTVVRPTELAAEPGDRVAVTGTVRDDRLVGEVETLVAGPEAIVPGPRKTAVLMLRFPGSPANPWSAEGLRSTVFTGGASVNAFYEEESHGSISLTGKLRADGDVFGTFTVDTPAAGCPYEAWRGEAEDAAAAAGVDLSGYDHLIYMFPSQSSCSWLGIAGVSASGVMINGNQGVQVIAHEVGHNLGLFHAGSWTCTSGGARVTLSDTCTVTEYGDPFDLMGNISTRHNNGRGLEKLGFLTPSNVRDVTASGTYSLSSALEPTSQPTVLRIRRGSNFGETSYYYLEIREQGGIFENFADATTTGVSIRIAGESYSPETLLLDANPTTGTFQDAPLKPGQAFDGGPVRFTTVSAGGGSATVSVTLDGQPPTAPTGLTATAGFEGVHLEWNASSDNYGVDRYVVYRDGVEVRSTEFTEIYDGAPVGEHSYVVYAEDEIGNRSAASAPLAVTVEPDEEAPTAPTEPTAAPGVEGVWVGWEESSDDYRVDHYTVYRDGAEVGTSGGSEFLDAFAAAGAHTYVVYAEDAAGNKSDASDPVVATLAGKVGPECGSEQCTVAFWHTGAVATWTVPLGVSEASFTVEGAQGGGGDPLSVFDRGARAVATLSSLTVGEEATVSVGGMGETYAEGGAGGFGGGGDGTRGGGGGGYSSVELDSALKLLAAGGGGSGLPGLNATTAAEPAGGRGGRGGDAGTPGGDGGSTEAEGATLGGGAGGAHGGDGGQGGAAGAVSGVSICAGGAFAGADGAAGGDFAGGGGAAGSGGGGGGGYVGGGQGGGGAGDDCGSTAGSGGGGGGTSFVAGGVSATITGGIRRGYGSVKITYDTPVVAIGHTHLTPPGQALVVPAAEGLLLGASGPDAVPPTASLSGQPNHGAVTIAADGAFTYTPDPGYVGLDYFSYRATDLAGDYAVAVVRLTVGAAPSASISAPVTGGTYVVGQVVSTAFSCAEGAGGPGLASCVDSNGVKAFGPGKGRLDTATVGSHAYTVTGTSWNDIAGSKSIEYTVVASQPPRPPTEPEDPPRKPEQPRDDPREPPKDPGEPPRQVELTLAPAGKSLRELLRIGKLVVTAKVSAAAKVALVGRAQLRVRARRGAQAKLVTVLAKKTVAFAGPGEREVTLLLSRQGRAALRGLSALRLTIAGTATDSTGGTVERTALASLTR